VQTGCRANADPSVVRDKLARVASGPTGPINALVDRLHAARPGSFIPYVDPDCGGIDARILMLFQDPGPRAGAHGSGMLSNSNDDPSAETVWHLFDETKIAWRDATPWNSVPWYTGGRNSEGDRSAGINALEELVGILRRTQVVVTFGGVAASSWGRAIRAVPALERFTHVATLHPSIRGLTRGGRQRADVGRAQLFKDFGAIKAQLR
jgi:hypothetical protein